MNPRTTILVGGGGGASVVVPHLAEAIGLGSKNAKNAPVISTIGVALAMIRDMVERTIPNPSEKDILAIRREAEQCAIQSGADPDSIEISIDIDTAKNIVRATAIGATEFRSKDLAQQKLTQEEILKVAADNMDVPVKALYVAAENGEIYAIQQQLVRKKLFGLLKNTTTPTRIIDAEGVIRLQKSDGKIRICSLENWKHILLNLVDLCSTYDDGGRTFPNTYLIFGKRIIDLSGLADEEQIISIAQVELATMQPEDKLILLCSGRMD